MNAYKLLEQYGLEITHSRVGRIQDWERLNQGRAAVLVLVPRNRRMRKEAMLVGRLATPQRDIWITEHDESKQYARRLLDHHGLQQTQHRIRVIADVFRASPCVPPRTGVS